jgi:release factor glutamine methyltransferase
LWHNDNDAQEKGGDEAEEAVVEQQQDGRLGRAPSTIGAALTWAYRALHVTSPTPRLDAEVLLMHAAGLAREQVLVHPELELRPEVWTGYMALVQRRMHDEPVAYLTGRREFMALDFRVTPAVLIPRPETEVLVERVTQVLRELCRCDACIVPRGQAQPHVVDVGTGSGAIAVSLAVAAAREPPLRALRVTATELSAAALQVAQENAAAFGVLYRVRFVHASLLSGVDGPVHVVAANLPYIASRELHLLPASVRDYEPLAALNGGPDGLRVYDALFTQVAQLVPLPRRLCIEIGHDQSAVAQRLAVHHLPGARCTLLRDLAGWPRVLDVAVP